MKSFSVPLVVLLAVTSGCGSRTTRHSTSWGDANARPADIPAMRALLEQYSPASYDMVTTYEALPTVYVFGNTTTLSHSGGFADRHVLRQRHGRHVPATARTSRYEIYVSPQCAETRSPCFTADSTAGAQ